MALSVSNAGSMIQYGVSIFKECWTAMWRDDVPFYAAGIAFHSLFSIFALLFFLSLLLGLFGADPDNLGKLSGFASGLVPAEAQELVNTVLEVARRPVPASLVPIALVATFWTASNVIQAVIHALNRIYHLNRQGRAAWRTRLMALSVVGVSALLLILGFVLLVFGRDISTGLAQVDRLRMQLVGWTIAARQPLSVVTVFLGSLLVYWLAPSFNQAHRVSWPGALFFTLAWIPATIGFNLYLREFAVYNRIYGPVATVVVMLVWVYLSAFLGLMGGEVNAAIHKRRAGGAP